MVWDFFTSKTYGNEHWSAEITFYLCVMNLLPWNSTFFCYLQEFILYSLLLEYSFICWRFFYASVIWFLLCNHVRILFAYWVGIGFRVIADTSFNINKNCFLLRIIANWQIRDYADFSTSINSRVVETTKL